MPRKRKTQISVDSAGLLKDPDMAAANERYLKMGLTLDPKARWYAAKGGKTLVVIWRGDNNLRAIHTVRFRTARGKTVRDTA